MNMLIFQRLRQLLSGTVGGLLLHVEDERDLVFGAVFKAAAYQPKNRVKSIKTLSVKNQQSFNTCTWNSAILCKEFQEGKPLSVRFLVAAGREKGRIFGNGFASLRNSQQTLVEEGSCEETLCPDVKPDWNTYSSPSVLTYDAKMNAGEHKSQRYFLVQTLNDYMMCLDGDNIIQTGLEWYTGYNKFNVKEKCVLEPYTGVKVGGHAVACVGYDLDSGLLEFQNSFGEQYGNNGRFFVRIKDWFQMGFGGYVMVDVDNSQVIASYEGKDVKTSVGPGIYRIESGKKRVYHSADIFFKHGGRFGTDKTWQLISANILNSIPEGSPME